MPRSIATPALRELEAVRVEHAATVSAESIQFLDVTRVQNLLASLGLGTEWGLLTFNRAWLPHGASQAANLVNIERTLRRRARDCTDAQVDQGVLALSRLALVYFLLPQPSKSCRVLWKPSTIVKKLEGACRLGALGLTRQAEGELGVFRSIPLGSELKLNATERSTVRHLLRLGKMGVWRDTPLAAPHDGNEKKRRGASPPTPPDDNINQHQPFSDRFTGEAGWRCAWLIQEFAPCLLACAGQLVAVRERARASGGAASMHSRMRYASNRFLKNFAWSTEGGGRLLQLPFDLRFENEKRSRARTGLPERFADVRTLLKALQSANLFAFLISCGGRISEALSLLPGCVVLSADGPATITGRTYKLVLRVGGEVRDWPVPSLAVLAMQRQEELTKVIAALYPEDVSCDSKTDQLESVWSRLTTGAKPFTTDYNDHLSDLIAGLGLTSLLNGDGLSAHRFRKSTARLVALAIVAAPQILMLLFGHKDITSTLYYILADPQIRTEIEEVARAQTIMLAEDAIRIVDKNGGPAARSVKAAVAVTRAHHGREYKAKGIRELAETLTFSGHFWQLVRGGVICTKGPLVEAPCQRGSTTTDSAKCQSTCAMRLEQAFLKDDVDRTLAEAVRQLGGALDNDDEIMAAEWVGQIQANLPRFPDLDVKWRSNPLVATALGLSR